MPLSTRASLDTYLIPISLQSPADLYECRMLRVRLLSELLSTTEQARSIALNSPADVDAWYDANMHVLDALTRLRRLILPLEG